MSCHYAFTSTEPPTHHSDPNPLHEPITTALPATSTVHAPHAEPDIPKAVIYI
ncbi:hypothetical protein T440DRAFT_471167 [Plenodomus tracheiphilus IPT5]|uniref:Uncharacterized protein n=1 Tax=Plenodomus tracheiphilus IPT5 TaxID=1408161 RepID=A0A6A7AYP5_9PLEO|nr:hypothetical protein T440DRAFT_471167 [Plenodomus tracheiphilus IPT5]